MQVCACEAVFILHGVFQSGKVNEQEGLDTPQSHHTCSPSPCGSQSIARHMSSASPKQVTGIPEVPCNAGVVPGVQGCVCLYSYKLTHVCAHTSLLMCVSSPEWKRNSANSPPRLCGLSSRHSWPWAGRLLKHDLPILSSSTRVQSWRNIV